MLPLDRTSGLSLLPSDYVDTVVLAANVYETITPPSNASHVVIKATVDFYALFIRSGELLDLVTNGDMGADTDWTKGTGWTIASDLASSDASQVGDSDLEQVEPLILTGKAYEAVMTISGRGTGALTPVVGGVEGSDRTTNAEHTEIIIAGANTPDIALRADASFDGDVTGFSIAPVAQVPAADYTGGVGVELNPDFRRIDDIQRISLVSAATCIVTLAYYEHPGKGYAE